MRTIIEVSPVRLAREEGAAYCGFTECAMTQGSIVTPPTVPPMHLEHRHWNENNVFLRVSILGLEVEGSDFSK